MANRCDETYEQRIRDWIAVFNQDLANETRSSAFVFHRNHACYGNSDFSRAYAFDKNPLRWSSTTFRPTRDYSETFRTALSELDSSRPLPPLFDLSRPRTPVLIPSPTPEVTSDHGLEEHPPEDEDDQIPDLFANLFEEEEVNQTAGQLEELSIHTTNPPPNPLNPPSPPSEPESDTMADQPAPAPRPMELRINVPEAFDGNREKTKQFLNKVVTYLSINADVYTTDERKIGYTLSFMTGGLAERWANTWRDSHINNDGTLNFGTWGNFYTEVVNFFKEEGGPMKAAIKLANIKMTGTADAYTDEFRDLVQRAGLTDDIAIV